ncbi:hypothetical protein Tco_0854703 [Tanacetum coccineum]
MASQRRIPCWDTLLTTKGFRVYNRVTRKVQDCLHVNFLENQENQKGKGPDWMFDLDLLTPSMNYIPVREENYADSKEQGISCDDVEDLDDQQFIVHTAQPMHPEERTATKRDSLSSEEQALHDSFVILMHQDSLEPKLNSDDDTSKDGIFSTNSFDAEEGGVADYNNMDPTIDESPTLLYFSHTKNYKMHPQSQIIGKSTAGVNTRKKKLQDSTSNQHQHCYGCQKCIFCNGRHPAQKRFCLNSLQFMKIPAHVTKQGSYRVDKALYGLASSPEAWYERPHSFHLEAFFSHMTTLRGATKIEDQPSEDVSIVGEKTKSSLAMQETNYCAIPSTEAE